MTHHELRQRWRLIAASVAAGKSVAEVAAAFDVHEATVRNACHVHRVVMPKLDAARVGSSYSIIADLCCTSLPLTAIADKYGTDVQRVSTVYRRCIETGVPVRKRKRGRPSRS